ncbi:MAG: FG-GAP-like repeat-containing protein [Planctomycetota bacterium]
MRLLLAAEYPMHTITNRRSLRLLPAAILAATLPLASTAHAQEVLTRSERSIVYPVSTASAQYFGRSVATDGNRAVVGAPGETSTNTSPGTITIFERTSGDTWVRTATFNGSEAAAGDWFGDSVAIDGDYAVVGAPYATGPLSTSQGAAYVFRKNGATWVQAARLTASDGANNDLFGASIAIKGDTVVVGAPEADVLGGANRGAAYVFRTNGTTWTQEAKLIASNGAAGDLFGWSVSTGQSTALGRQAIVGAPGRSGGNGSSYLFRRSSSTWSQVANFVSGQVGAVRFGESVGLGAAGGFDVAFVGAPDALNGSTASGAVFVLQRSATTESWSVAAQLSQVDGAAGDRFGASLSAHDDRLVAGAPFDGFGTMPYRKGSATVFRHAGTLGWQRGAKLTYKNGYDGASQAGSTTAFGASVSIAGERIMIGAPALPTGASLRGAAYNFKLDYQQSSMDDNGRDDIVWFSPSTGSLAGWSMFDAVRETSASGPYAGSLGTAYEYCGTGDLYGDGRTCVVYREKSTGIFRARRMNGTAVVSDLAISGGVPGEWRYVALADISGDGKADVVLRNALTSQINAWIMDGNTKMDGGAVAVASGLEFLGAGDLDGDGRADLVWRDAAGLTSAWLLRGRTVASSAAISGVGAVTPEWRAVAMADLDGDGDRDIVWRNILNGNVSGWRMQGLSRQQGIQIAATIPMSWRVESAPDLDGDGTDDLLWRNMANGDVSRWRMVNFVKSSGTFVRNVAFSWSCLSDDDYNDDRGWDGNGDDDNWDDSNGDDWNDDHGGDDSDDNSGGNETVDGSAFVNSINTALVASSLPILEVEAELEGGVSYVQVYQWIAATQQLKLVVVRVSSQTVVYTTTWTPTADDLVRYGDAIDVLGVVTVAATTAVNQALAANPGAQPHAVELSSEDLGPVWDVELLLANGTFVTVVVNAN